ALLELLKNPTAQQPLRDEFNKVAQGRDLTGKDYNRLPQSQAAFKEALRMHPTVFMSTREVKNTVEVGGIQMEPHDIIRMDLRKLHSDPANFENPGEFKPSRFEKNKFPQAFMPFGTGPRVCLGINMAMYEGAIMLSQIFNRVDLKPDALPTGDEYYFTTRPKGPLSVTVSKRLPPA
ncbi:MAG: cytochrome P450, partial [Alphaproteobacteria bacterium]